MRFRHIQSFIAALLLLAYTVTGTQMLAGLVSMAALFEGSHDLLISQTEEGTRVILHHRAGDFTPSAADHRGAMARVLTAFCSSNGEGDHCLSSTQLTENCSAGEGLAMAKTIKTEPVVNEQATLERMLSLSLPKLLSDLPVVSSARVSPASQMERLTTVQIQI